MNLLGKVPHVCVRVLPVPVLAPVCLAPARVQVEE